MVQLKYEQFRNLEIKHTLANSRGGRNLNLCVNLRSKAVSFLVMEKKKIVLDTDDLQEALKTFNDMEATEPGTPTKAAKKVVVPAEQ